MAKTESQHFCSSLSRNVWLTHDGKTTTLYWRAFGLDFTGAVDVLLVFVTKYSSSAESLNSPDGTDYLFCQSSSLGDGVQGLLRYLRHYHEHQGPKDHDNRKDGAESKSESPRPGIGESETGDESCDK